MPAASRSPSNADVQLLLAEAEALFDQGEFRRALDLVGNFDAIRLAKQDPALGARVALLKTRLAHAFGDEVEMMKGLDELMAIAPQSRLDPLKDPPTAQAYWRRLQEKARLEAPSPRVPEDPAQAPLEIDNAPAVTPGLLPGEPELKRESRFWVGLLPFGIGHFDSGSYAKGALFLGGETAILLAVSDQGQEETRAARERIGRGNGGDDRETLEVNTTLLGVFGLLGFYGHELVDSLPELARRDRRKTEWTRYGLSFFPFGAAQLKNGDKQRALGFAVAQTTLLSVALLAPRANYRLVTGSLFSLSLLYGAYDGWARHAPTPREGTRADNEFQPTLMVMPWLEPFSQKGVQPGAMARVQWALP